MQHAHFFSFFTPVLFLRCPGCPVSPPLSKLTIMPPVDVYDRAIAVCRKHWPREGEELMQWHMRVQRDAVAISL